MVPESRGGGDASTRGCEADGWSMRDRCGTMAVRAAQVSSRMWLVQVGGGGRA